MKFEPPPPADEGPGTLTVHLDGASGLKAVDFGGKSDPYAILSIGEQRHTHRRPMVGAWTPRMILDMVCKNKYNALIDTGALITGYSNHGVIKYVLQHDEFNMFDVGVFLNDHDEQVFVTKANDLDPKPVG